MTRRRFRKRADRTVVAVQLRLETEGFTYEKWGGTQRCRPGDWLVLNGDDTYTVSEESFARTYALADPDVPGIYRKTTVVWAERAPTPGVVATREGTTAYDAGDYLVSNHEDGSDEYAVSRATFEASYEPVND